jgi:hypothetical protein
VYVAARNQKREGKKKEKRDGRRTASSKAVSSPSRISISALPRSSSNTGGLTHASPCRKNGSVLMQRVFVVANDANQ